MYRLLSSPAVSLSSSCVALEGVVRRHTQVFQAVDSGSRTAAYVLRLSKDAGTERSAYPATADVNRIFVQGSARTS